MLLFEQLCKICQSIMTIDALALSLKKFPYPSLRKKASLVEDFSEMGNVYEHMLAIMYENDGIGLAANQVGLLQRCFVMDLSENKSEPVFIINPEIINKSDSKQSIKEGCLSLPGLYHDVSRPKTILLRYINLEEKICEREFTGLASSCVQHEIDHLDGILFPDRILPTKQAALWKKYLASVKKS